jgi:hypothetical protein
LAVLFSPGSTEQVVVRERLQARGLPNRQASTLRRIEVYVVVAIFADVARDGRRETVCNLHTKPVVEVSTFANREVNVAVFRE